ncbi:cobyrinate a,c-diamide synthase [Salidesulfovibrio onnuriiensis]|uniref:cobyrinate a,c-diamide synthase n=1 Tax=Salidesulfovibrio onnuriiensis TaxID=2583823 RepID=UPI0011C9C9E1|nr:cobyrinate a,c-diamide synthase [Salidesulfovibrio onnuriiensis]
MSVATFPRLLIAGLSGGTGKTIVSLGLARAWTRAGKSVRSFKKGPDYIDATWLGLASRRFCTNLDPYFLSGETLRSLVHERMQGCDVGLIEGNRGLFDGKDEQGSCSSSELARQLETPVVLAIDCTKMTRTVAAIVQGCAHFEPGLRLAGVICNRTAGERHRAILRRSIEEHTDVPVLGMLPKFRENPIPERHMGLMSDQEYDPASYGGHDQALDAIADVVGEWLDLDALWRVAESAPEFGEPAPLWPEPAAEKCVRIGYVHDEALWFYYQENLEALERAGAELVRLSLLDDQPWPEIHGLYLGGGFPETLALRLANQSRTRIHVKNFSEAGMPIYAECGGFMYLCDTLEYDGSVYPMAGVFPVATSFCPRPQGLGYTEAEAVADTPFYARGTRVRGHEFHYSRCVAAKSGNLRFALKMERGNGMLDGCDGLVSNSTFAGYNHIHALAVPDWAPRFVAAALKFKAGQ